MSLTDLLNSAKKGIFKASLGLSLIFSPLYGCGGEDSSNNNSYSQDAGTPDSGPQWPECPLREYVDRCEDFTGTYEVVESDCANRYGEVGFVTSLPDPIMGSDTCSAKIGLTDKKNGETTCFPSDDYMSNSIRSINGQYSFKKCSEEIIQMKYNNGECTSWLRKTSSEPSEGLNRVLLNAMCGA